MQTDTLDLTNICWCIAYLFVYDVVCERCDSFHAQLMLASFASYLEALEWSFVEYVLQVKPYSPVIPTEAFNTMR